MSFRPTSIHHLSLGFLRDFFGDCHYKNEKKKKKRKKKGKNSLGSQDHCAFFSSATGFFYEHEQLI